MKRLWAGNFKGLCRVQGRMDGVYDGWITFIVNDYTCEQEHVEEYLRLAMENPSVDFVSLHIGGEYVGVSFKEDRYDRLDLPPVKPREVAGLTPDCGFDEREFSDVAF